MEQYRWTSQNKSEPTTVLQYQEKSIQPVEQIIVKFIYLSLNFLHSFCLQVKPL